MYFWIHIVPSRSPAGPRFMFSVANMQGPGGSVPYLTFDTMDNLAACLRSIKVREEDIGEMGKALANAEPFSLPNVYLSDEDLKRLGLYVLGRERFSAISAVEGLELDPESAKRLERTNGFPPETRRAETIQAFEQLRKRG